MSKKRKLLLAALILVLAVLNVLIIRHQSSGNSYVWFQMDASSDVKKESVTVYDGIIRYDANWDANRESDKTYSSDSGEVRTLKYYVRSDMNYVRVQFGATAGATWKIKGAELTGCGATDSIDLAEVLKDSETQMNDIDASMKGDTLVLKTTGTSPILVFKVNHPNVTAAAAASSARKNLILKVIALVILDGVCLGILLKGKKLLSLPIEVWQNRRLIMKLAKNDFKTKYAGSYLGIFWAFVQPVVTVLVYWVVFGIGLKAGATANVPFVLYLTSGIVPWFYLQEVLTGGTNALIEYSYLVKKVVFKISVLPMVKAISAFFVHMFFICVAFLIAALYGIYPSVYAIQIVYYFFCMFIFSLGLIYGTCAIVIFFRDLSQIISIILQIGIWTIPIMWNIQIAPPEYRWIFRLNPMYYIVNGYRDSIYNHQWFWSNMSQTVYFWAVTLVLFGLGAVIFKRLKVHFADVL